MELQGKTTFSHEGYVKVKLRLPYTFGGLSRLNDIARSE